MTDPARRSVTRYYNTHLEDFTVKKIRAIKNLSKEEQNKVIKDVQKTKDNTKDRDDRVKDWKAEAILDVNKRRAVYIDVRGNVRARSFKGRFIRVPKRFRSF